MSPFIQEEEVVEGIWDTHHHIFDNDEFPYSPNRHLTPPRASVKQFQQFKRNHGVRNSVLVHGLSYGHDTTSLKAFMLQLDPTVTRGVAVINRRTSDAELADLHERGVRGIRLDLYLEGAMRDLEKQREMLVWYAHRIKHLGWSMGFLQLEPRNWEALAVLIPTLPVNVVVDHHALMRARTLLEEDVDPARQEGMAAIVAMLKGGNFWVKLSAPYRSSEAAPRYADMQEIVRHLVDANPRRVIWGSDWPHTPRMKVRSKEEALCEVPFLEVDDKASLSSLRRWLSDEEWRMVMVENPQELFGW